MAPSGVPTALLALTGVLLWMRGRRGSQRAVEEDVRKAAAAVDAADLISKAAADTAEPAFAGEVEEATMERADGPLVRRTFTTGSDGMPMVVLLEEDVLSLLPSPTSKPSVSITAVRRSGSGANTPAARDALAEAMRVAEVADAVEQGAEDEVETARARKIASRALLEAHWVANSNGGSTTGR